MAPMLASKCGAPQYSTPLPTPWPPLMTISFHLILRNNRVASVRMFLFRSCIGVFE